jgi:hypothetical protein
MTISSAASLSRGSFFFCRSLRGALLLSGGRRAGGRGVVGGDADEEEEEEGEEEGVACKIFNKCGSKICTCTFGRRREGRRSIQGRMLRRRMGVGADRSRACAKLISRRRTMPASVLQSSAPIAQMAYLRARSKRFSAPWRKRCRTPWGSKGALKHRAVRRRGVRRQARLRLRGGGAGREARGERGGERCMRLC